MKTLEKELLDQGCKYYNQYKATAQFRFVDDGQGGQKREVYHIKKLDEKPVGSTLVTPETADWHNTNIPGMGVYYEETTREETTFGQQEAEGKRLSQQFQSQNKQ